MLHPGVTAALADGLVKEIVGSGRSELRHVSGPETSYRLCDQLKFRHRNEIEPAQLLFASLGLRIKCTDRLECIAKKIEPNRHIQARRIKIENSAAHRIVARFTHGRCADVPIEFKPLDHAVHAEDVARRNRESVRCHKITRRHALKRRIYGGEQDRRFIATFHTREPRQRGHALSNNRRIGRYPVVGQTIPGRKFHDLEVGAEKAQSARQRSHPLSIAADNRERNCGSIFTGGKGAREIAEDEPFGTIRHLRQRQGFSRLQ